MFRETRKAVPTLSISRPRIYLPRDRSRKSFLNCERKVPTFISMELPRVLEYGLFGVQGVALLDPRVNILSASDCHLIDCIKYSESRIYIDSQGTKRTSHVVDRQKAGKNERTSHKSWHESKQKRPKYTIYLLRTRILLRAWRGRLF